MAVYEQALAGQTKIEIGAKRTKPGTIAAHGGLFQQHRISIACRPDLQAETEAFPEGSTTARELGFQTILAVPLLRESTPFGALVLRRTKVELFSDKQIELVETFADQAVIAIENVRLFEAEQQRSRELSESLQQQTATSEVLRVISSSPGELEPRPCWRTPRGFARPVTAPCGLAKEMASVSLLSMAHCLRPSWSNCGAEPCSIPARTSH